MKASASGVNDSPPISPAAGSDPAGVIPHESHLPETIVTQLARLAGEAPQPSARPPQQVLDELMASQQSILGSLRIPSADVPDLAAKPSTATPG